MERIDYLKKHGSVGVMPRTLPARAHLPERSAYPMLVTFGDGSLAAGFYAITYDWKGERVISYRGTKI